MFTNSGGIYLATGRHALRTLAAVAREKSRSTRANRGITGNLTPSPLRASTTEFGGDAPETAYTGGMFVQIGRLALLSTDGEAYVDLWLERPDRTAFSKNRRRRGRGSSNLKRTMYKRGRAVGKACNLSQDLRAVLRGHRRPMEVDDQFQLLVSTVALALKVAHLAGDLDEENPWDGEAARTDELQNGSVTRHLAERESLSSEEPVSMTAGNAGEAGEFVGDVLDTVA